jgi:hypothetical protein
MCLDFPYDLKDTIISLTLGWDARILISRYIEELSDVITVVDV